MPVRPDFGVLYTSRGNGGELAGNGGDDGFVGFPAAWMQSAKVSMTGL